MYGTIPEISSIYLAFVAAQAGLCLTWSETSKTGLLVMGLNYCYHQIPSLSPSLNIEVCLFVVYTNRLFHPKGAKLSSSYFV